MDERKECPECHSQDLQMESVRDRYGPKRNSRPGKKAQCPLARTLWIRCGRCGHSWPVTNKIDRHRQQEIDPSQ
jgi:hypothetical protein